MKKTLTALAMLKSNWDLQRKDYIQNFVPFVTHLINIKSIRKIYPEIIIKEFKNEWGLIIPNYPMRTILTRMRKQGYIERFEGSYIPVDEKILKSSFNKESLEKQREYEKVVKEFVEFSKREHKVHLSNEEAEESLINFLKKYDLDVLFLSENKTILPEVKSSKKNQILLYSFIKNSWISEPEIFKFIVNIAIGHTLANAFICYYDSEDKINNYSGNLKNKNFFLDAKIIFSLIGTEGEERRENTDEFLNIIRGEKGNLKIFQHTFEEVRNILESCARRIDKYYDYDPKIASTALKYFKEKRFTRSDIERIIVNLPDMLNKEKIEIVLGPDITKDYKYQIDEEKLKNIIISSYKEKDIYFNELEKDYTIEKDIRSISLMYRLRGENRPITLNETKDIFVTKNNSLVISTTRFEKKEDDSYFSIPVCMTDVFLGTLIWLNTPHKRIPINAKKIISDCCAALMPNYSLLSRFLEEIEKLKNEKEITEIEYHRLRTYIAAEILLNEKTLGDVDNISKSIAGEILEELERDEKIEKERRKKENIKSKITKIVKKVDIGFRFLIVITAIYGIGVQFFPNILPLSGFPKNLVFIIFVLVFSVYLFNVKKIRIKIIEWLIRNTTNVVYKSINRILSD